MMDFLKTYPFMTMEDYLWRYSYAMVRLMAYDASRVITLTEKQAKKYKTLNTARRVDNPFEDMDAAALTIK